jgi:hypothetical protein
MREMYWAMDDGEYCILREETVRKKRKLQRVLL